MKPKDKFTPIHNEVLESLAKINLSPYESRVLYVIFRKTYGFINKDRSRKKSDWIAYSQITEISNLDKRHIARALKGLIRKKVISRDDKQLGFSKGFMKEITVNNKEKSSVEMTNKVISRDDKQVSKVSSVGMTGVISRDDKKSSVEMNTKESKETITKEIYIARFEEIWKKYPNKAEKNKAEEKFLKSVTTDKAWKDINMALDKYLVHLKEKNNVDWKRPQMGKTWFNIKGWKGWIDYKEEENVNFSKTGLGADSEEIKKYRR